jgi:hypothetical protein
MLAQWRFAAAVSLCSLALFAFQRPLMADTLDRRLIGAWTTSKDDCAKTGDVELSTSARLLRSVVHRFAE